MTFNEYQKEALRTANPECRDLTNAALGLCGESAEFVNLLASTERSYMIKQHLAKELGDVAWYVAVASHVLGYDLDEVTGFMWSKQISDPDERQKQVINHLHFMCDSVDSKVLSRRLMVLCGGFADQIKKHRFQGHELDKTNAENILSAISEVLAALFWSVGYSFEEGLQMNVDKLRKRYPEGFDVEKSLHREEGDV